MRVEIVTECEHGQAGKHLLAEKRFDGCDQCRSGEHGCGNPHFDCPGGSRRVLEPGSFVLVEKVNGEWPPVPCVRCGGSGFILEDRPGFVAEKLGCFDCDGDGVAPRNVVKAILDALAEGEQ